MTRLAGSTHSPRSIDARAGADGAQEDIGIGLGLIGMFDQKFGGKAQIPAAAFVKTLGVRVAIDGVVIREFILLLNQVGVAPTEEVLFDIGAVGVMADGAFAGVALGSREFRRSVAVGAGGFLGVEVESFGDEFGGVCAGDDFGEMHRLGLALGPGACNCVCAWRSALAATLGRGARGYVGRLRRASVDSERGRTLRLRRGVRVPLRIAVAAGAVRGERRFDGTASGMVWRVVGLLARWALQRRGVQRRLVGVRGRLARLGLARRGCGLPMWDFAEW